MRIAIRRVLTEMSDYGDPRLAEHMQPPTLSCGLSPCYAPSPPVEWVFGETVEEEELAPLREM